MNVNRQAVAEIDPVCGMTVSPETAAAETTYKEKTYYFCADACRRKFEAEPEKYLPGKAHREVNK